MTEKRLQEYLEAISKRLDEGGRSEDDPIMAATLFAVSAAIYNVAAWPPATESREGEHPAQAERNEHEGIAWKSSDYE